MRLSAIIREAWANLLSGTSRAALFGMALSATMGGLVWAELSTVQALIHQSEQFQTSGADVLRLHAKGLIDGTTCERLSEARYVRASGALRSAEDLAIANLPTNRVPQMEVSPHFAELLDVNGSSTALMLSTDLAAAVGGSSGQQIFASHRAVPVSGIFGFPDDGRQPVLSYAALSPVPASSQEFDECWVKIWPKTSSTAEVERLLYLALAVGAQHRDVELGTSQLNGSLGEYFDGVEYFDQRQSKHHSVVGLGVGMLLGFLSVRLRRIEIASALHSGVSLRAQAGQLCAETLFWTCAAAICGLGFFAFLAIGQSGADSASLMNLACRIVVLSSLGVIFGATIALLAIRENRLAIYTKNR